MARQVDASLPGRFPNSLPANPGTGEVAGAGSTYRVTLVERPNMANTRNSGDDGLQVAEQLPIVTMDSRKTGKIGG
jgi:hypothetical protein